MTSHQFSTAVTINADSSRVWNVLTKLELMPLWMGEPDMNIEIHTNWQVSEPLIIRGFHHVKFENKGVVLKVDKYSRLSYTHLSSLSRLADLPANYSIIEFVLTSVDGHTALALQISNFPTESIRKHLEFYWRTTVLKIKESAELK